MTLESSSTVSCRCLHGWSPCVAVDITSCRQLRPLVRSISEEAVKTLVQAFISCHLYYCNSLFYGIAEGLMSRLQSVQNAAARLVSGARRYDHITPVLQELQWH